MDIRGDGGVPDASARQGEEALRVLVILGPRHDRFVRETLPRCGRRVTSRGLDSASEITLAAAEEPWQVLFAEHGPPALAAVRTIEELGLELPCIAICAPEVGDSAAEAVRAGVHDVVSRDAPGRLLVALERALREAALRQERGRAREALRQSEQRFDLFMRHLPGVAFIKDDSGEYVWASEYTCSLLGRKPEEIPGKRDLDLWPREVAAALSESDRQVLARGRAVAEMGTAKLDGHVYDHATVRFPIPLPGGGRLIGGISVDVSQRRRAERQLQQATTDLQHLAEQLRVVATQMTQVEQRERRRLAQLLHDHLQQLLVGAKSELTALRRRTGDPEILEVLERVDKLLKESLDASRSLTVELNPPILHEAGLGAALHWLARWMEEKYGLAVETRTDAVLLDDALRVLLFHAARELLFNVVKHSGAATARMRLASDGSAVSLVVEDDGVGFDAARLRSATGGFGLFSVRERLTMLGGSLEVDSNRGEGTRVTVRVPLGLHAPEPPRAGSSVEARAPVAADSLAEPSVESSRISAVPLRSRRR